MSGRINSNNAHFSAPLKNHQYRAAALANVAPVAEEPVVEEEEQLSNVRRWGRRSGKKLLGTTKNVRKDGKREIFRIGRISLVKPR